MKTLTDTGRIKGKKRILKDSKGNKFHRIDGKIYDGRELLSGTIKVIETVQVTTIVKQ